MKHIDFLKEKAKQLPEGPGIYKMLDSHKTIIYVGKSKNLRKRVQSYFTAAPKWEKVTRMVSAIRDIDHIRTDTHLEARLLECRLIKELQPRFNAQMKNDGSYFFLKVESGNPSHPISIVLEREEDCFGPFRSKYSISELLDRLRRIYPISRRTDGYEFEYHLFPLAMDAEVCERNRQVLLELFSSEERLLLLIQSIMLKMAEAVSGLQYEMAAIYRDMVHRLKIIRNGLNGYQSLVSRQILLKLPTGDGFKLFYVSKGRMIDSIKAANLSEETVREFISNCRKLEKENTLDHNNEKAYIDYRDVLYSEIVALAKDQYELL